MNKIAKVLLSFITAFTVIFCCSASAVSAAQPEGYVTISFEDNGIRVADDIKDGTVDFEKPMGVIIPPTKVPFYPGESIAEVTIRLLNSENMGYSNTGTVADSFYLSAIKNFHNDKYGDVSSFGEFDAGPNSGWMVTLNNWFINMSTSAFEVESNDVIRWKYTCQLGADIGCDWSDPTAKITGLSIDKKYGTLSPSFSSNVKAYTLNVPKNIDSVCLEAQVKNAWSKVEYSVGNKNYKPLAEIPVKDGTKIVITSAFSEYAGDPPSDTDKITITISKPSETTAATKPETEKSTTTEAKVTTKPEGTTAPKTTSESETKTTVTETDGLSYSRTTRARTTRPSKTTTVNSENKKTTLPGTAKVTMSKKTTQNAVTTVSKNKPVATTTTITTVILEQTESNMNAYETGEITIENAFDNNAEAYEETTENNSVPNKENSQKTDRKKLVFASAAISVVMVAAVVVIILKKKK